jgi:hypothetical protein
MQVLAIIQLVGLESYLTGIIAVSTPIIKGKGGGGGKGINVLNLAFQV